MLLRRVPAIKVSSHESETCEDFVVQRNQRPVRPQADFLGMFSRRAMLRMVFPPRLCFCHRLGVFQLVVHCPEWRPRPFVAMRQQLLLLARQGWTDAGRRCRRSEDVLVRP